MSTSALNQLVAQLQLGFPTELATTVHSAALTMDADIRYGVRFRTNPDNVSVSHGDPIRVLSRHGFKPRTSHNQTSIQAAIASQHYDGFVRQRSISPLLEIGEPWTMPYILELASDYVIEILTELDKRLADVNHDALHNYITQNPHHLTVTTARINSYWNEYYRQSTKAAATSNYPGFRILTQLTHP